jgi:hypothetical protein
MDQTSTVYATRRGYVDTLGIIFSRALTLRERFQLEEVCKSVQKIWRKVPFQKGFSYVFQVISPQAIRLLEKLENIRWMRITRMDVAVDLICKSIEQSKSKCKEIQRHLTLKCRNPIPKYFEGTKYSKPRGSEVNQVIYREDNDRHTEQPCVHVEWRIKGSRELAKAGIYVVRDVIDLDLRKLIQDRSVWEEIDYDGLGRFVKDAKSFVRNAAQYHGDGNTSAEAVRKKIRTKWKGSAANRVIKASLREVKREEFLPRNRRILRGKSASTKNLRKSSVKQG